MRLRPVWDAEQNPNSKKKKNEKEEWVFREGTQWTTGNADVCICSIVRYRTICIYIGTICIGLISTVSYGLSKVDILTMSKFSPNA